MALTSRDFTRIVDFGRASSGTYVGSDGLIKNTSASKNLQLYTQDFSQTGWGKTNCAAYLVDPATTNLGSELVSNGTFPTDTSGWTATNGTLSVVSAAMRVTNSSTVSSHGSQALTLVPGKWYRVVFDVPAKTAASPKVSAGISAGDSTNGSYTVSATGTGFSFSFRATAVTTYISAATNSAISGNTADFDNISVKEILAGITAPDGTPTGSKIVHSVGTSTAYVAGSTSIPSTGTYTYSVYLKAAETSYVRVYVENSPYSGAAYFVVHLHTGEITFKTVSGSGVTMTLTTSEFVGDGWYRVRMTCGVASGTLLLPRLYFSDVNDAVASVTGDGLGGFYVWGSQIESGYNLTSYEKNFSALYPPRIDCDPVTKVVKGLVVEAQKTNLMTWSQDISNAHGYSRIGGTCTVTPGSLTAPDGTVTASAVAWVSGTSSGTGKSVTVTPGSKHTFSAFVKAGTGSNILAFVFYGASGSYRLWFNLSTGVVSNATLAGTWTSGSNMVENYGNGWWRVSVSVTPVTDTTVTGEIDQASAVGNYTAGSGDLFYVWGFQLETLSSSSYIPTTSATVTRIIDSPIFGGNLFNSIFNPSAGTVVIEWIPRVNSEYKAAGGFGTGSNYFGMQAGNFHACGVAFAGDAVVSNAATMGVVCKAAYCFDGTTASATCFNGGTVATGTNSLAGLGTQLSIGRSANGGVIAHSSWIRSLKYYNYKFTNAQLQAATT